MRLQQSVARSGLSALSRWDLSPIDISCIFRIKTVVDFAVMWTDFEMIMKQDFGVVLDGDC